MGDLNWKYGRKAIISDDKFRVNVIAQGYCGTSNLVMLTWWCCLSSFVFHCFFFWIYAENRGVFYRSDTKWIVQGKPSFYLSIQVFNYQD